jgi:hypothetical protein
MDAVLSKIPGLTVWEAETRIRKTHLLLWSVVGSVLLLVAVVDLFHLGPHITEAAGFLLPATASFHAIHDEDVAALARWCNYWIAYSCAQWAEHHTPRFVLRFIPSYYLLKLLFLATVAMENSWVSATF